MASRLPPHKLQVRSSLLESNSIVRRGVIGLLKDIEGIKHSLGSGEFVGLTTALTDLAQSNAQLAQEVRMLSERTMDPQARLIDVLDKLSAKVKLVRNSPVNLRPGLADFTRAEVTVGLSHTSLAIGGLSGAVAPLTTAERAELVELRGKVAGVQAFINHNRQQG